VVVFTRYQYIAVDAQNKKNTGTMEALDKSAVLTQLQDKGLVALSISSEEENAKKEHQSIWTMDISVKDIHRTKIKKKKLLTVMNQMGIMMKAGVSLSLAMSVLIGGEKDRKLKMILTDINEDLYTGTPISAAMAKFDAFPEIIVNIVESGETNGRLDVAFERCAEIIEKELAITTKIRGAMGYPAFLFILVIGLVVIMNIVVLP
jgi:type II secretory pathway component PulF